MNEMIRLNRLAHFGGQRKAALSHPFRRQLSAYYVPGKVSGTKDT